ncbi:MAG: shikimate dehydrogenase [Lautropia sp.]|nr:shikimate dehydrogenase [Lautropia sp.]
MSAAPGVEIDEPASQGPDTASAPDGAGVADGIRGPDVAQHQEVLCGLIGEGIQASRTPWMHEQEGRAQGLRYRYRLIDTAQLGAGVDDLPRLLAQAEAEGFRGLNITYPFKQRVVPLLHELSDNARALDAVNTVVLRDGCRIGHNTDCSGWAAAFARGLPDVTRDEVVLLGAGGAGSAVAHAALLQQVGRLHVCDTVAIRAQRLVDDLQARFGADRAVVCDDLQHAMKQADGLIHCTPTGMAKQPGLPLPAEWIEPRHWVSEIIYFPLQTELLRVCRRKGCRTLDGSGMAVFQAVDAFRFFTGLEPDVGRMLASFGRYPGQHAAAGHAMAKDTNQGDR